MILSCDVLADLLESIERFINHLQLYTQLPPTPTMSEVLIKLNVELISMLTRVTGKLNNRQSHECSLLMMCHLAQHHAVKFGKNFFGVKDIKKAQQRLDRVTQDKFATPTAQIHSGVDRLERKFLQGKRTHAAWNLLLNNLLPSR